MQKLYNEFVTMHKLVFHLYGFQQQSRRIVKTLKEMHYITIHVQ